MHASATYSSGVLYTPATTSVELSEGASIGAKMSEIRSRFLDSVLATSVVPASKTQVARYGLRILASSCVAIAAVILETSLNSDINGGSLPPLGCVAAVLRFLWLSKVSNVASKGSGEKVYPSALRSDIHIVSISLHISGLYSASAAVSNAPEIDRPQERCSCPNVHLPSVSPCSCSRARLLVRSLVHLGRMGRPCAHLQC